MLNYQHQMSHSIVVMMSFKVVSKVVSKITRPMCLATLSVFLGLSHLRPRCFLPVQLPPLTASNGNIALFRGGKPVAQLNLLRRYTDLWGRAPPEAGRGRGRALPPPPPPPPTLAHAIRESA